MYNLGRNTIELMEQGKELDLNFRS